MKQLRALKIQYFLVTLCTVVLLAACSITDCAVKPNAKSRKTPYQQRVHSKVFRVRLKYYFTAETAYRDIRIIESHLVVIYLPASFKPGKEYENWKPQRPWYKSRDLKHADIKLTNNEINQLIKLVKSSGFLKLKSHSGAPYEGRCYPTTISVELNGKKKNVEYDSPPMPKAFANLEKWLMMITKVKIKDF